MSKGTTEKILWDSRAHVRGKEEHHLVGPTKWWSTLNTRTNFVERQILWDSRAHVRGKEEEHLVGPTKWWSKLNTRTNFVERQI